MANQKEIHIKLFNLVKANNIEEFQRELLAAKEDGFDFFHTEIDDSDELEDIYLCDSFAEQMAKYQGDVSEKINQIFLDEIIVSSEDAQKLCAVISQKILNYGFGDSFLITFFNHIIEKKFSIEEMTLDKISKNFLEMICTIKDTTDTLIRRSQSTNKIQKDIENIKKIVLCFTPLLPQANIRIKNLNEQMECCVQKINAASSTDTSETPQEQSIAQSPISNVVPLQQTPKPVVTSQSHASNRTSQTAVPTSQQHKQPPASNAVPLQQTFELSVPKQPTTPNNGSAKNNDPRFLGISPRGWLIIAACAIIGAVAGGMLGFYLLALGTATAIATGVVAGGVVGGGVGYLINVAVDKCCGKDSLQTQVA